MIDVLIKTHTDPEQLDFTKIWKEGLFIFDSNVLLDLYRLPETARKDLISILEDKKFNSRIWIGFQVFLEFLNNRYSVIADQKGTYKKVIDLLETSIDNYKNIFMELERNIKKELPKKHSTIDINEFTKSLSESKIENSNELRTIQKFILDLQELEDKHPDVHNKDDIKDFVVNIFKEKVGKGFEKTELEKIYLEGKDRYTNKIPPGYEDAKDKTGEYRLDDKEYIRKYGDLILWKEIIEKAKTEEYKYITLVTGDVKDDWFYKKRGKRIGPRKELLSEIYISAPKLDAFHLYDTSAFLKHAKEMLKIDINESSITETKELIEKNISVASYCILNTNINNDVLDHESMMSEQIAAAYFSPWKYKIERLKENTIVFLYQSGVGIVAMGKSDGEVHIRNYHNDSEYENEEYYVKLNNFCNLECNPIQASEIKRITNKNHTFLTTLFCISKEEGELLFQEAKKRCCPNEYNKILDDGRGDSPRL